MQRCLGCPAGINHLAAFPLRGPEAELRAPKIIPGSLFLRKGASGATCSFIATGTYLRPLRWRNTKRPTSQRRQSTRLSNGARKGDKKRRTGPAASHGRSSLQPVGAPLITLCASWHAAPAALLPSAADPCPGRRVIHLLVRDRQPVTIPTRLFAFR
ncbi:hypothetical protein MRX96_007074 [Rhipicephalus microplus]